MIDVTVPGRAVFPLRNKPNNSGLWAGIAGNHQNLPQILEEFIDNSISNLRRYGSRFGLSREIIVRIEKLSNHKLEVSVTDGGTGILDVTNAITLAGSKAKESSFNEHGFGLKHALASADKDNDSWRIITRTREDALADRHKLIEAPYKVSSDSELAAMSGTYVDGNGGLETETGTRIYFRCHERLLSVLRKRRFGKFDFRECVAVLAEELSFTYAPIIEAGEATITLVCKDEKGAFETVVEPLCPVWEKSAVVLPEARVSLCGKEATVNCRYGTIVAAKGNAKYYKCNMASSGVEIRLDGRAITHGQLPEIWGISVHPSWNSFCAIVDVRSDEPDALPSTKSAKNGLREDDERTEALYEWIRGNVVLPKKKDAQEDYLLDKLCSLKKGVRGMLRVEREAVASHLLKIKARIDLLTSSEKGISIYEAKLRHTKARDVYQLRMYWDLCVAEGLSMTEGVLVSCKHPKEVAEMVEFVNELTDPAGKHYNFRLSTWREEGIAYDESVASAYSV